LIKEKKPIQKAVSSPLFSTVEIPSKMEESSFSLQITLASRVATSSNNKRASSYIAQLAQREKRPIYGEKPEVHFSAGNF